MSGVVYFNNNLFSYAKLELVMILWQSHSELNSVQLIVLVTVKLGKHLRTRLGLGHPGFALDATIGETFGKLAACDVFILVLKSPFSFNLTLLNVVPCHNRQMPLRHRNRQLDSRSSGATTDLLSDQ